MWKTAVPAAEDQIWGLALDPRINASYAAAFALLGKGFTLFRSDAALDLADGNTLPPGAFVLTLRKGLLDEARELSMRLHAAFHPVAREPETKPRRLERVKTALFKPWRASMDEGWTRYLFDTHLVPYENVTNEQIKNGDIGEFDVLLLADISPDIIKSGKATGEYARFYRPLPPDYQGGIGDEGVENIKKFVEEGGTLICFGPCQGDVAKP